MKFFVFLFSFTSFVFCKQAVKNEELSTIDQIKAKARQLYKKFDTNNDGHISFAQLTSGIKHQLGFGKEEESTGDQNQFKKMYEKFFADRSEKAKMTQEDFQELFLHYYKKGDSILKNPKIQDQKLKARAKELFEKFDKNNDGKVSLDQIKEGVKEGLNFGDEQKRDQKSIGEYSNQLYQKYIKSDKKDQTSFTKQDFYEILQQNQNRPLLQKIRDRANNLYDIIDTNKDQSISLDQLTEGIEKLFGFDSDKNKMDEKTLKQRAKQLYEKYMKIDPKNKKGLTKQDIFDIIQNNMKDAKDKVYQIKEKIEDKITPRPKTLDELVQSFFQAASDLKQIAIDRIDLTKQSLKNLNLKEIKEKAQLLFDLLDVNKDQQVSIPEITKLIKNKLGFKKDCDKDKNSLFHYFCDIYKNYIQSDKLKQIKITKKEFLALIDQWGKKLDIPKDKKKGEQL